MLAESAQTLVTSEGLQTITIADLFLIMPVLVLTGTAVLAMLLSLLVVTIRQTAFITVAGLLLAA